MDAAAKSSRLYPSYTTKQIREFVIAETDPIVRAKMEGEIARREAGISAILATPQIEGGRAVPHLGRM